MRPRQRRRDRHGQAPLVAEHVEERHEAQRRTDDEQDRAPGPLDSHALCGYRQKPRHAIQCPTTIAADSPRVPIQLKVEYKKLNTFFADYTKNICKGGTFIRTKKPLDIGTVFVFQLGVPKLAKPIEIRGEVKWVKREGEPSPPGVAEDHEPGMGIRFIYETPDERERARGRRREDDDRQPRAAPVLEADGQRPQEGLMATSRWRYAVPNAFTAASLVFAVLAIEDAIRGRVIAASGGACTAS